MVVEQMARCAWNARPDERGLCGRMAWNPQLIHLSVLVQMLAILFLAKAMFLLSW